MSYLGIRNRDFRAMQKNMRMPEDKFKIWCDEIYEEYMVKENERKERKKEKKGNSHKISFKDYLESIVEDCLFHYYKQEMEK